MTLRHAYTFVTVVFEEEYDLLLLQARSLRIYCDRDLINSILVIDNSKRGLSRKQREKILSEYGDIACVVTFVHAGEIAVTQSTKGWIGQQILKLAVARIIATDRYVILDAKNHFILPFTRSDLETDEGRPRMRMVGYATDNPLRPYLEQTLSYYGLNREQNIAKFVGATTPFIMYRDVVRKLIEDLQSREQQPFETVFASRGITEFFSYGSYIIKSGQNIEMLYQTHKSASSCIWVSDASKNGCDVVIARTLAQKSSVFSVHRAAIAKLPAEARRTVAEFLFSRSLFESPKAGQNFLQRLQAKLVLYTVMRPFRKLRESIRKRLVSAQKLIPFRAA